MSKASRDKGARGERELAAFLTERGFYSERTGRNGRTSEDIMHAIPGVHIECKRCERLEIPDWVRQARRDANGNLPVVAHRRSRGEWYATSLLEDFLTYMGDK